MSSTTSPSSSSSTGEESLSASRAEVSTQHSREPQITSQGAKMACAACQERYVPCHMPRPHGSCTECNMRTRECRLPDDRLKFSLLGRKSWQRTPSPLHKAYTSPKLQTGRTEESSRVHRLPFGVCMTILVQPGYDSAGEREVIKRSKSHLSNASKVRKSRHQKPKSTARKSWSIPERTESSDTESALVLSVEEVVWANGLFTFGPNLGG
ncbi:hypothetical protein CC79DRAFT_1336339 [Sarocladium strictum]